MSDQAVFDVSLKAGADLSAKQFHVMKISAADTVTFTTSATAANIGLLQNKPAAANRAAHVRCVGKSKGKLGGTVTVGAHLTATSDGTIIATTTEGDVCVGYALGAGDAGDIIDVLCLPCRIGT